MLVVFLDQQIHRRLWNGHQADGVFRLGPGELQRAVRVADILLADRDRFALDVHVIPPQGHQFTLSQAADQFQIEHGKEISGLGSLQIGVHGFRWEDLHFQLPWLGGDTVFGGIPGYQPLLDRPFQGSMEHQMDAVNRCGTQPLDLCLSNVYSALLQ